MAAAREAGKGRTKAKSLSKLENMGPLLALAGIVVILSFVSDAFLSVRNIFNIISQSSVNFTMALGMTVVIISGGIDLSVGSVMALTGSAMALLGTSLGWPAGLAILAGVVIGMGVGAFNGFVISRTGIPDFIMTLGMLSAARGIALIITGGLPVSGLPEGLTYFGAIRLGGVVPVAGLLAAAMAILVWYILGHTKLGRYAYAIGGNKEAARAAGINVGNYKVAFYALIGFTVAVASLIQVGRIYSANPVMGTGKELEVIAIVIIGGTNLFGGEGSIGGTVVGALIMGVIANGLNLLNVSSFWQQFFIGSLIIVVVVVDQLRRRRS